MSFLQTDQFLPPPSSLDDVLIKQIVLTHDPDGRHFDSELLLRMTENIMHHASTAQVSGPHLETIGEHRTSDLEVVGSQEPLEYTINQISYKMLGSFSQEEMNPHARTMILFDLLTNYKWDAKLVLVLAAFAISYGKVWLILQLYQHNPLAVSIAALRQLPSNLNPFKPQLKALRLLAKTMAGVTKLIIKFEGLPITHINLDYEILAVTKSQIYTAAYWVIRSALICSARITDLTATKHDQPSDSATIATWELSSLEYRLSSICSCLGKQVDKCYQQIEMKIHLKLLNLPKEKHSDNQEVLRILFASRDDLPLKDSSSQAKIGVSELKNKVIILLISKPELLNLEALLFLVQQIYDQPHRKKLDGSYEIVWVPIPYSQQWTEAEERSFNFLSNSLPWYSIRRPWLLSSALVNYTKQTWNFKDEPVMVVLDSQGTVTNLNAIHSVLIWGARAYPFSTSREEELWKDEKWTLQLMFDDIDPLLTRWIEEGRNLCIYGSGSLDWIREFNSMTNQVVRASMQLEVVFVGTSNRDEQLRNLLATIEGEKLSRFLSFTKIQFFWLRLESIRRSKLELGKTVDSNIILKEVSALLDFDNNNNAGWAVMGRGSSEDVVKLQGSELMECLKRFPVWGGNVGKLGFLGAVRNALEPPSLPEGPCTHSNIVPYKEGLIEETVVCEKCKRPMEKFVLLKCNVTE
ncbi:protein SIEVE ELEMENT OCCLUSION C [Malania oleifera]|uniref:protein SIEVE ELEMENT OCCLUSION C n=1 Tax=Malania oleifera TaxID=397392 RepID=UPI0025AEC429|nr:protein SIEVE ELEMENT OCCLUSION C [Malania oleifera]